MEMIIDISNIRKNIQVIKKRAGTDLCAVVKCNAYGHGLEEVALGIRDLCKCFAVANGNEALRLTGSGIKNDIIVLSGVCDEKNYPDNVIFSAFDHKSLEKLMNLHRRFQIKVDTGMNRLGFAPTDICSLLPSLPRELLYGVYSHIYDISAMEKQTELFESAAKQCGCIKHIYATNSLQRDMAEKYDMQRIGLALYGYGCEGLSVAMSLHAPILQKHFVHAGENIGYGLCAADHDMNIATIQIGYGDGFRRKSGTQRRFVSYGGVRCEIIGQICMDLCMAEIPKCDVAIEHVEIIGDNMTADDVARQWDTVPYDVLTSLSMARCSRKYINQLPN